MPISYKEKLLLNLNKVAALQDELTKAHNKYLAKENKLCKERDELRTSITYYFDDEKINEDSKENFFLSSEKGYYKFTYNASRNRIDILMPDSKGYIWMDWDTFVNMSRIFNELNKEVLC